MWLHAGGRYFVGREAERGEGPESRARQRSLEFDLLYTLVDTLNEVSSRFGNSPGYHPCSALDSKAGAEDGR